MQPSRDKAESVMTAIKMKNPSHSLFPESALRNNFQGLEFSLLFLLPFFSTSPFGCWEKLKMNFQCKYLLKRVSVDRKRVVQHMMKSVYRARLILAQIWIYSIILLLDFLVKNWAD